MKILIINGPNLNLLGTREPHIYGTTKFDDYFFKLQKLFKEIELLYFQSNNEGTIIDKIHWAHFEKLDGIVLNAGAYTHYSYAISDAIRSIDVPVVEVHISNIFAREDFRKNSVIAPACIGTISGFGLKSYDMAIYFLKNYKN